MTASRNRRLLIVGVLATLFALGGGCLAYLTTASGGSATGSNAAGAGQASALASSDGFPSGTAGAPGADSSGGGDDEGAPPRPRQNVPTTGINLQGRGDTTCFSVLIVTDQVQVPLRVTEVRVRSTNGVIVHDPGGCSNCPGTRLGPGGAPECQVGVRLSGNKPYPEIVSVTITLTMDATCTDPSRKPCDDPKIAALSPTSGNPIAVRVTGTLDDSRVDPAEGESPDSPPEEVPSTPDPDESPGAPDTQSVPEPTSSETSS